MRQSRVILKGAATAWVLVACLGLAQNPSPASSGESAAAPGQASQVNVAVAVGGRLYGVVKSGNIPLPGVAVTAQNTLTGKRYATTTDITGAWSMQIPQNGRYVVRTEFAAFAPGSQEAVLNASQHEHALDFQLLLSSRAAVQEQQQARQEASQAQTGNNAVAQAIQQLTGTSAENLSLTSTLSAETESATGATAAQGAELPTVATNADFGGESVAISGQSGQVSALAGQDMDRLRDALATYQAQNNGQNPGTGGLFGGGGGGLFGGGGFGGGGFGGGPGGFGGGRGNFRGFNPAQPHGSVSWNGSNSALNAEPFSLTGQPQTQPASGTNRFSISFMSSPYIPGKTKPSGKDTLYLTLSGTRSSSPQDYYGTVPTVAERAGDFSAAGLPTIYNPATGLQFVSKGNPGIADGTPNVIPAGLIAPQATALLNYFPQPNLTGASVTSSYNYHLLTTSQSNSTQAGVRYMRSLGANATQQTGRGGGGGGRGRNTQSQGLRQSISANYNWSESASDQANMFPQLGGKSASDSDAVQAAYTVGYHRITSISNASWNRSNSHTVNFFTNTSNNVAGGLGITVPNQVPLNYGLPAIGLSNLTGLSQTQPNFSISQTISLSETFSWIHGKHNLRFGGDYRRVHRDFLAGSNATGSFTFTGLFSADFAQDPNTGSAAADFLLGYPQATTLNSSLAKTYLRDNVFDAYAQDDWRVRSSLTLNYGLRWEYFAPYTEKFGHLAMVDTNPASGFTQQLEVNAGGVGPASGAHLPDSLVYPFHRAFAPRVGLAWRVPKVKQTVVRAGFGMNYTVGEYGTFANLMAHQPPFTNEQTNKEAVGNTPSTACMATSSCFTLANGFLTPNTVGNYAIDPHYGLPYVMTWNLDIQRTMPLGIVLNIGYNGSRSNHLDVKLAPRALPASPATDPINPLTGQPLTFTYDKAGAYYKMNAATVRANKRLSHGVSMGANYQFAHAIDNASSVNGSSGSVVQDWLNLPAEEGNSSLLARHSVSGTYTLELPFGEDRMWATTGVPKRILEGFTVAGSFTFASGGWLTPTYTSNIVNVECGTTGALRLNRVPGVSVTAGGGSLRQWFNTAAFTEPQLNQLYPCGGFGNAPRNSIEGPGTVSNNMSVSRTVPMGDTRSMEMRASINNVFNTVQYSGVNTTMGTPTFGQVTSAAAMRSFQFQANFRF